MEPVDGVTVEGMDENVQITFSNRYGNGDVFLIPTPDARRVAEMILEVTGQGD